MPSTPDKLSTFSSCLISTRAIDLTDGSTVSYVCIPPGDVSTDATQAPAPGNGKSNKAAVVHFPALSGCAATSLAWAPFWQEFSKHTYLITVDRPGCHQTTPVLQNEGTEENWVLQRMRINTRNVLAVLQAEEIERVYILAVCLGHAYAIDFARELLRSYTHSIELEAISLVAPFVSSACSETWYMARLGNAVPSWVLSGATDSMISIASFLMPLFMKPSTIRSLLSAEEQLDWHDPDDYESLCSITAATAPLTRDVKAIEARVGSSHVWQQVVDEFAQIAGYGLQLDGEVSDSRHTTAQHKGPYLFPRIKIHMSPNDGMVTLKAAKWLARRCYADCEIVLHQEMSSHLSMTLLGGPPRSPRLLKELGQDEFGIH